MLRYGMNVFIGLVFWVATVMLIPQMASAMPMTLLDVDFNQVSFDNPNWTYGDDNNHRIVRNILNQTPNQLPTGTTWYTSLDNSPARNVNVRTGSNVINTADSREGFGGFFGDDNFLVLGDNVDAIGGAPNEGTFYIQFPFSVPLGFSHITISYAFAFDGFPGGQNAQPDIFWSYILGDGSVVPGDGSVVPGDGSVRLQNLIGPAGFGQGIYTQTVAVNSLPLQEEMFLRLQLTETPGGNSAFGVNNITITAVVPEPSTVLLLGAGILGLGLLLQRRRLSN